MGGKGEPIQERARTLVPGSDDVEALCNSCRSIRIDQRRRAWDIQGGYGSKAFRA